MNVKLHIDPTMEANFLLLSTKEKTHEVDKILTLIDKNNFVLIGKKEQKNYSIQLINCLRFYSENKKVFVAYMGNELTIKQRIYELETKLPSNFIKISQSEIINVNFIANFQVTPTGLIKITFNEGTISYSSRRYLKKVKEALFCINS